ncbi:tRNA pseudouridine32 synthase/23S rRNA pseudouridine746 synthase [Pseudonocardia sediminis]|uniref:RNA pseudouridylate synthase n=1 Tax=Pseudonocardia sediminis TaxID=1397368 RepID=A0A4Q7UVX2_PSEST|nr:RluA family pseudouridine synthase [Pseudonocardia sediminis]RZT85925.1 tRNA pseudouridine32 synthase/23S rRNA pseudouridine746 synthase [Pseudonocardia sediminis]
MRRRLRSPLPQRHGLDPARLRTPDDGSTWPSMRAHLIERLPRVDPVRLDEMLAGGEIVGTDGPLGPDSPFAPGTFLWLHRDLPDEVAVPFGIGIVHRDDDILVVDKPHFLATIPRGRHVLETALVRLRRELDLPALSPAHRLDRATAGLLLLVVRPELRGAYQTMFAKRRVAKTYEAIAPYEPSLELPRTVRSRIVKERGVFQAVTEPGEVNAETLVELDGHRDGRGRYRLTPYTGRTHQLRVHMSELGVPILGDDFYPDLRDRPLDDFARPLQLLARTLEFTDPVSGEPRRFESRRTLQAWDDRAGWSGEPDR